MKYRVKMEMKSGTLNGLIANRLSKILLLLLVDGLTIAELLNSISDAPAPVLPLILLSIFILASGLLLLKIIKPETLSQDIVIGSVSLLIMTLHTELNVMAASTGPIRWIADSKPSQQIVLPIIYCLVTSNLKCFNTNHGTFLRLSFITYTIFRKSYSRDSWKYELSNSFLASFMVLCLMGTMPRQQKEPSESNTSEKDKNSLSFSEINIFKDIEEGQKVEISNESPKFKRSRDASEPNILKMQKLSKEVANYQSLKGILKPNVTPPENVSHNMSQFGNQSLARSQLPLFQDKLKVFAPILKMKNHAVEWQARVELTPDNKIRLLKCRENLISDKAIKKTVEFLPKVINETELKMIEEGSKKIITEPSQSALLPKGYKHVASHQSLGIELFYTKRDRLVEVLNDLYQNYSTGNFEAPCSKLVIPT